MGSDRVGESAGDCSRGAAFDACGRSRRIRKPSWQRAELAEPLAARRRRRPQLRLVK